MQAVVEARNLRKRFDGITAVDGISFQVLPGETFGILGPNGAGKTSTIRMLYGFSPPSSGEICIFGLDSRTGLRSIKYRIGVCQQENNLDPDLTVEQNLLVFASYFDIPPDRAQLRARELLEFISLDHRRSVRVLELSGDMMRRLMLARSLISEPDLLILDEPTTGLDPQSRHQLWERLEELKRTGLTILLTTHNMDEASELCSRLIIMDHGTILEEGSPQGLINTHVGREVLEIASPSAEVRREIRSLDVEHDDLEYRMLVYTHGNEDLRHRISERYCQDGCSTRMATLEDVFLKLTGRSPRE